MEWVIIVACVVGIAVSYLFAREMENIAEIKGFSGYFWWCFWLPLLGGLLVCALPDRRSGIYQIARNERKQDEKKSESAIELPEL